MDLDGERRSTNIEDRRGRGGGGGFSRGGGSGFRIPMGRGSLGLMAIVAVIYLLMGGNLSGLVSMFLGGGVTLPVGGSQQAATPSGSQGLNRGVNQTAQEAETADRVAAVLGSTEDVWATIFREAGQPYKPATLVLFSGQTPSPCGAATTASGPFYCPADAKVYLDMAFFDDMATQMAAGGDFAQAYVVAHEIGHHVQGELGTLERAHAEMGRRNKAQANAISVRIELQADCYAGIWAARAQRARPILQPGDLEEAVAAAQAVGDDRLQKQAQGYVVPDSFTHGTSAQRVTWFQRGYQTGDVNQCDTFSARTL